jgi:hypothetical protein
MFSFTRRDVFLILTPRMRKMINILNVLAHNVRRELRKRFGPRVKKKNP